MRAGFETKSCHCKRFQGVSLYKSAFHRRKLAEQRLTRRYIKEGSTGFDRRCTRPLTLLQVTCGVRSCGKRCGGKRGAAILAGGDGECFYCGFLGVVLVMLM